MRRVADDLHRVVRDLLAAVAADRATVTYEALLDDLGRRDPALRVEVEATLAATLRAISVAEDEAGRGLLTAVVVRSGSGVPGGGFFALAADRGRDVSDRRVSWEAELARVHQAHAPAR